MNPVAQAVGPPGVNPADRRTFVLHRVMSGLALANFAFVLVALGCGPRVPGKPVWFEAALVFTATAATLVSLCRQLPVQNVVLAAVVIAFVGGVAHAVGAATTIPFGPVNFTENAGPRLFRTLAWPMPLVWIIAILNSRGVARLMLRRWRETRAYGFWLLGVTAVLVVLFDAALEPFASAVKRYWIWSSTGFSVTWYGAPVWNFLGWLVTALLILALATPALIDKRARPVEHPPDYHPLVIWLLAMLLFGAGASGQQLWAAAGYCALAGVTVARLALRSAKGSDGRSGVVRTSS